MIKMISYYQLKPLKQNRSKNNKHIIKHHNYDRDVTFCHCLSKLSTEMRQKTECRLSLLNSDVIFVCLFFKSW